MEECIYAHTPRGERSYTAAIYHIDGTVTGDALQGILGVLRGFAAGVGIYKILFYFEAIVAKSILIVLPPPTCIARAIAILLHVYCAI